MNTSPEKSRLPKTQPMDDPEEAIASQDPYRKVILGEVADPLYPPHPGPPETEEDLLTRAALEDPAAHQLELPDTQPTVWRAITVVTFAVIALGIVFWWTR